MRTNTAGDGALDAGELSAWLDATRRAVRGERDARVPCGGCTACCTASQFVHVGPEEHDALAHIPDALLFAAPGLPEGHRLMGYDDRGACPMFVDGACSIYEHRPRACRTYDCRVFAAAGVEVTDDGKTEIAARVRRWRFTYEDDDARVRHDAVRAAAAFLRTHPDVVADRPPLRTATQIAVLAVEIADAFLADHAPTTEHVRAALTRAT
jgi:Fe-S-cluster containining protein